MEKKNLDRFPVSNFKHLEYEINKILSVPSQVYIDDFDFFEEQHALLLKKVNALTMYRYRYELPGRILSDIKNYQTRLSRFPKSVKLQP